VEAQAVSRPRCLFVTRKYPPQVGGMETLAAATARALAIDYDVTLVALGKRQSHLVWWLPMVALRSRAIFRRKPDDPRAVDVVVFGDALAYCALRPVLGRRIPDHLVMVMGLDLTFTFAPYQAWLRRVLPRAPRVVAISRTTAEEAIARGVAPARVRVIAPGVLDTASWPERAPGSGTRLRERLGIDADSKVVITIGRLVPRKGVKWFVQNVMSRLPENVVYVVAGAGPDEPAIRSALTDIGTAGERVMLLGRVDDALRVALFTGADIFVMPNVATPGDMEGFGLVVEAAAAGAVVVASALEGIRDAVIENETGFLCPAGDGERFVDQITGLLANEPERARLGAQFARAARSEFSIERMRADLASALSAPRSG
jgi:phosphatidyl-myo-inositol dimannoside synthase